MGEKQVEFCRDYIVNMYHDCHFTCMLKMKNDDKIGFITAGVGPRLCYQQKSLVSICISAFQAENLFVVLR